MSIVGSALKRISLSSSCSSARNTNAFTIAITIPALDSTRNHQPYAFTLGQTAWPPVPAITSNPVRPAMNRLATTMIGAAAMLA